MPKYHVTITVEFEDDIVAENEDEAREEGLALLDFLGDKSISVIRVTDDEESEEN